MSHPFREAVERRDADALFACLAPDVRFRSPAVFRPYEGREAVSAVLAAAVQTFEDFRYTDELRSEDGLVALIFEARVGERELQGIDLLREGPEGVTELTVMIRPLSGLVALAEQIGARLQA
jgi:hypothetical protein